LKASIIDCNSFPSGGKKQFKKRVKSSPLGLKEGKPSPQKKNPMGGGEIGKQGWGKMSGPQGLYKDKEYEKSRGEGKSTGGGGGYLNPKNRGKGKKIIRKRKEPENGKGSGGGLEESYQKGSKG